MYLRHLHVKNVKLLRDVEIDFVGADDRPRMWTVFVGENRLCKTTLLQTIAAAACGPDRGTQLVTDVIASWPDLRNPVPLSVDATFGFGETRHKQRQYPDESPKWLSPPKLRSRLDLEPDRRVFSGGSSYMGTENANDPLTKARARDLPEWFVAGYGPSRLLRSSGMVTHQNDPMTDRLRSLFGESLIGTSFIEILGVDLGRAFAKVLQSVFIAGGVLPHVIALELRGRGGIRSTKDLVEAQRFEMDVLDARGKPIRVPATWLSQGYQTLIAWLADVVGQILLDAEEPLDAAEMEGLVLVDEIDLHLHPVATSPDPRAQDRIPQDPVHCDHPLRDGAPCLGRRGGHPALSGRRGQRGREACRPLSRAPDRLRALRRVLRDPQAPPEPPW